MSERVPPYRGPLPGPLAAVRRAAILAALGRSTPARLVVGGLELLLEPAQPDPRPVFGLSLVAMLAEGLGPRVGERVLDLGSGTALPGLAAARGGAQVVVHEPDAALRAAMRRAFLVGGLGDPPLWDEGDLAAAPDGAFDLIAWLPPWLAGPLPADPRAARICLPERALVTTRLRALRRLLSRGGRLRFPFPDRDATPWLHEALAACGYRFAPERYAVAPVLGPVRLYAAWPALDGPAGEVDAGSSLAGAGWVLRDR